MCWAAVARWFVHCQAAEEGGSKVAREQQGLDRREAQLLQGEANLKELQALLHSQRTELHYKDHQLQVLPCPTSLCPALCLYAPP